MLRHIQEDIFMKIYYLDKIHNSGAKYKIRIFIFEKMI